MKLNRFLLAEDPRNNGGLAIIHTIEPMAIIQLIEGWPDLSSNNAQYHSYVNSDGIEEHWTLLVHHLFTTNMNNVDDDVAGATIDKLLTRAWHWYKSYLEWEDQNLNNNN